MTVVIVGDDELAIDLEHRMAARGVQVSRACWHDEPRPSDGLVLLAPGDGCVPELASRAFRWLQACGPALKRHGGLLAAVTRSGGRFGLEPAEPEADIETAALSGLVKTAAREWPEVRCRVFDLPAFEPDAAIIDTLVWELARPGPAEVGIDHDGRYAMDLASESQADVDGSLELQHGDLVVVSGGARGVTAEAVRALAVACRPTLLILGRTPVTDDEPHWLAHVADEVDLKRAICEHSPQRLSPREVNSVVGQIVAGRELRAGLARLAGTGAAVEYRAVDVRDAAAVRQAIADARQRFGPVRGLVHGSGVLADRRIEDKTAEQFDAVYGTKVAGLKSLLAAVENDPLKFLAVFSSSTARFGRVGQCDYAAANEVLNLAARQQRHRRPGCRVVAFNWGPWDGGMVTPSLRRVFEAEGVGVIPLADGARFFANELSAREGPSDVVVLGPAPESYRELVLSPDHPVLASHVLDGRCVLPAALAAEWLVAHARGSVAELTPVGCDNLKVLHPVTVAGGETTTVRLRAKPPIARGESTAVPAILEVVTAGGPVPAYRCDVLLASHSAIHLPTAVASVTGSAEAVYRESLFHGPELQGLISVDSCDDKSIVAMARPAPPAGQWAVDGFPSAWSFDPLLVDCALQAVLVWVSRQRGSASLPTGWRQLRSVAAKSAGPATITARVTGESPQIVRADITVTDQSGQVALTLAGCEFVLGPTLRRAFQRNSLQAAP